MKWPDVAPKHRTSLAEGLLNVTPGMLTRQLAHTDAKAMRSALLNGGCDTRRRGTRDGPAAARTNPMTEIKWSAQRVGTSVDRRVVVNPDQARALLDARPPTSRSGYLLADMFACMYDAALRPDGHGRSARQS